MDNTVRLICFYLPQYHPIPENDRWWGEGFTDWKNVARAKPLFDGHYQPHLPAELGYYDLRQPEVREAQAALASEYGIYGFCYHHYWFGGHRLLERPFNEVLSSGKPDFPFCLCWANENWTRRWDGRENEILIQQQHSDQDDINFIRALFPAFQDKRYIRINDKPLLIVYRTDLLPDPIRTATIWREQTQKAGLGDLYLCRAETFTSYGKYADPAAIGFDAALEFPPHAIRTINLRGFINRSDPQFITNILDYEQVVYGALMRPDTTYKLFRGVMPAWDNTPRRGKNGTVFVHSTPELYKLWLSECIRWTGLRHCGDERLVFINAWNEWAEGCHLEPDTRYGRRYLEATRAALRGSENVLKEIQSNSKDAAILTDSETGVEHFSESLSQLFCTNMMLKKQVQELDRQLNGNFSLFFLLERYLCADRPQLRRTRKMIYHVLQKVWRCFN